MRELERGIDAAVDAIEQAGALVVSAGAGMGVDSGLPDFRGAEGFWRAYPPFRALGLHFEDLANPVWFARDPALAWGFYGHRLGLYRRTRPHEGFSVLRRWGDALPGGAFVFTSNVDAAFQAAGFSEERVVECHGTLAALQCLEGCGAGLFASDGVEVDVDPDTFRARGDLPSCPRCGALARPNVLMFWDVGWDTSRTDRQRERLWSWLRAQQAARRPIVVVECGAGVSVSTVRRFSERTAADEGGTLIRINVRDPEAPPGAISLAAGARQALVAIDERLPARFRR